MRRSRLISTLIALAVVFSGSLIVTTPGAGAESAEPEIAYEGWYARAKQEDPQVVIPCDVQISGQGCGPVSPADFPAPQSKSTGAYVVASAGGEAGDDDGEGDTGWAAFQWDLFPYLGATADTFVVTLTQAEDNDSRNQGDTWRPGNEIFIQACNVLDGWSSEPGSNPWDTRPPVSDECVVPTIKDSEFTFDVSSFAQSWLEAKGFGFVIRPGTPDKNTGLPPFQITFSGYYDAPTTSALTGVTTSPTAPKVAFEYTPAVDDGFFGEPGGGGGGGGDLFEDITTGGGTEFAPLPNLDVIPTDVGSEEILEEEAPVEEALPTTGPRRTRPISTETGFPWAILLLLPLAMIAFWGTGTALGPIGDPVPARQGGVSRVLAERQAANGGDDFNTRN